MAHCKFSERDIPGKRIKDVIEVATQAKKNVKWFWNFNKLLNRLSYRERDKKDDRPTRFYKGGYRSIKYFRRLFKIKGQIKKEIIIAQPGISKLKLSPEIISVLGSADAYTKTTIETPLLIWCVK
jgi:hypothetical protein